MKKFKNGLLNISTYMLIALLIPAFTACDDDEVIVDDNVLTQQDRDFAINATYSNRAEIDLGQMAVTKAENEEVRAFAQQLIDDHTLAQNELQSLVTQHELTLPEGLRTEDQMLRNQLDTLSGYKFDSAFVSSQIPMHELARDIYEDEAENGNQEHLVEHAATTLPDIIMHLNMAMQLNESLNPSGE
jgi:putative membrane protein